MTILQFQTQQPGIPQSQRSWSILLQTVPGASRSVPEVSSPWRNSNRRDAAIAAWLARPAPDRARSVPLRVPDISSPWRNSNRRDALLSETAGTAILQNSNFRKIILRPPKKLFEWPLIVGIPPSALPTLSMTQSVRHPQTRCADHSTASPVSCLMSPVSCLLSHVSCLLSPVSCLLSPVSCLLSPVSCLLSPVSCLRC